MATFWRRIREVFYGSLPDDFDQEVGVLDQVEVTDRPWTTNEPVDVQAFGDTLSVKYTGALVESDRPIYIHFGYGPGPWKDVQETMMYEETEGVLETEIVLHTEGGSFEFCFRNDVGEWDNNGGKNWSHPI